ncbi:MAG: dTDP-4-dehydrorhamnose reductase [Pseudomonadales bacterium]|nr:dTDP-4-dehydrorhamnose reductase [Pseudomonadales bacterium]
MMRILVIGANGQLGAEFMRHQNSGFQIDGVGRAECDICDLQEVQHCLNRYDPDVVINCAAYTAVDAAEENREVCFAVNHDGVLNLAKCCAERSIPLVHFSTDYVFDGQKEGVWYEDDTPNPINCYGESKLAGEDAIRKVCNQYLIFRISWVFGQYGPNFVKTMLRLAKTRSELNVVSDQYGGPTATPCIVRAVLGSLANSRSGERGLAWGTYHLPSEPFVSWAQFAEFIFAKAQELELLSVVPQVHSIPTSEYPTPAKRPLNSRLGSGEQEVSACDWQTALGRLLPGIIHSLEGE